MPISLTLTEGVIAADKAPIAVARITESFLKHHGLAGNRIMTANATGPRSRRTTARRHPAEPWP